MGDYRRPNTRRPCFLVSLDARPLATWREVQVPDITFSITTQRRIIISTTDLGDRYGNEDGG